MLCKIYAPFPFSSKFSQNSSLTSRLLCHQSRHLSAVARTTPYASTRSRVVGRLDHSAGDPLINLCHTHDGHSAAVIHLVVYSTIRRVQK